jgi:hypothetical protein
VGHVALSGQDGSQQTSSPELRCPASLQMAGEVCGCIFFGGFLSGEWVPSCTGFSSLVFL